VTWSAFRCAAPNRLVNRRELQVLAIRRETRISCLGTVKRSPTARLFFLLVLVAGCDCGNGTHTDEAQQLFGLAALSECCSSMTNRGEFATCEYSGDSSVPAMIVAHKGHAAPIDCDAVNESLGSWLHFVEEHNSGALDSLLDQINNLSRVFVYLRDERFTLSFWCEEPELHRSGYPTIHTSTSPCNWSIDFHPSTGQFYRLMVDRNVYFVRRQ